MRSTEGSVVHYGTTACPEKRCHYILSIAVTQALMSRRNFFFVAAGAYNAVGHSVFFGVATMNIFSSVHQTMLKHHWTNIFSNVSNG